MAAFRSPVCFMNFGLIPYRQPYCTLQYYYYLVGVTVFEMGLSLPWQEPVLAKAVRTVYQRSAVIFQYNPLKANPNISPSRTVCLVQLWAPREDPRRCSRAACQTAQSHTRGHPSARKARLQTLRWCCVRQQRPTRLWGPHFGGYEPCASDSARALR